MRDGHKSQEILQHDFVQFFTSNFPSVFSLAMAVDV